MNPTGMDRSPAELAADPTAAAALQAVLSTAESTDGTVRWRDVRDDVPAEQWGRLLAAGVLVPVDDGRFVIDDPTAVRDALAAASLDGDSDDGGSYDTERDADGWTVYDKAAGIAALALLSGYQLPVARDAIAGVVDVVLGPVAAAAPFPIVLVCLALATTVSSTAVRRRLQPAREPGDVSERLQDVRERLEAARERGDEAAVERFEAAQQALVREQVGAMKGMVRPLVWTMLFTVPVFVWLSWLVVAPTQAVVPAASFIPVLGRIYWTARVLGPVQAWMLWYAVCSLATGVVVRRTADRVGVPA